MFTEDCWNLSDSGSIDVEEQRSFGSWSKKQKKENEAEGENPLKEPE